MLLKEPLPGTFRQVFEKKLVLRTEVIWELKTSNYLFGCSINAAQQQMALNFELVVSDQLFSVVLAVYK